LEASHSLARVLYRTTSEGGRKGTDNVNPHLPPQYEDSDYALKQPTAIIQILQKIYAPLFVFQNQVFLKKGLVPTYLRNFVQYKHPVFSRIKRTTKQAETNQTAPAEGESLFFFEHDDPRNAPRSTPQEGLDGQPEGPLRFRVDDPELYGLGDGQEDETDDGSYEEPDISSADGAANPKALGSDLGAPSPVPTDYYQLHVRVDEIYPDGESSKELNQDQFVEATSHPPPAAIQNPRLLDLKTVYGGFVCVDQKDYDRTVAIPNQNLKPKEKEQYCFNTNLIAFWQQVLMKTQPRNYFCLDPGFALDKYTDVKIHIPSTFWNLDGVFFPQIVEKNHWILYLIRPKTKEIFVLDSMNDKFSRQLPPLLIPLLNKIETDSRFIPCQESSCDESKWKDPVSLKLGSLQKKTDQVNSGVYLLTFLETLIPALTGSPPAETLQQLILTRFKNEPELIAVIRYKVHLSIQLSCTALNNKFTPANFENWQRLNEGAHRIFFRDDYFRYLECGGAGDCLYFSLLTALKLSVSVLGDATTLLPQDRDERVALLKALDPGYLYLQGRTELVADFRKLVGDNIQGHCETKYPDHQRKEILKSVEQDHQNAALLPTPSTYEELAEQIRTSPHRWGDDLAIAVIANQLGVNFWLYREPLFGAVASLYPKTSDDKSITKYIILKYRGNHYQLIGHRREDNTFQTVFDMTKPADVIVLKKLEKVLENYRIQEDKKKLQLVNEFAQDNDLEAGVACNILYNAQWDMRVALSDWNHIQNFRKEADKQRVSYQNVSYTVQHNLLRLRYDKPTAFSVAVKRLALYSVLMDEYTDLVPIHEERQAIVLGSMSSSGWNDRTVRDYIIQTIADQNEKRPEPQPVDFEISERAQRLAQRRQRNKEADEAPSPKRLKNGTSPQDVAIGNSGPKPPETRKRKATGSPEDAPRTKKSNTTGTTGTNVMEIDSSIDIDDELMPQTAESPRTPKKRQAQSEPAGESRQALPLDDLPV
jgi:hypothetical protein